MKTFILFCLMILVLSCSQGEKKCTISGGVAGGNSKALLLFKASEFPESGVEIPISNGSFTYSFDINQPEVYWLVLKDKFKKGSANEIPFFGEGGKIMITINGENQGYKVEGHRLNDALFDYYRELNEKFLNPILQYKDSVNQMHKSNTVYGQEFQTLQEALKKTSDPMAREQIMNSQRALKEQGAMYSPKGKRITDMQNSLTKAQKQWELEYIEKNTTLPALYLFMQKVKASAKNTKQDDALTKEQAQKNLERFSAEFPGHPYCEIIANLIEGGKQ